MPKALSGVPQIARRRERWLSGLHDSGVRRVRARTHLAMSRFRSAGFRNGRTAWRGAPRGPIAGGLHGGGAPHFAMGGPHGGGGPHGTPLRLGTRSRHGRRAPRGRRFTVGGSGKSVVRCHRTVLAYWKFKSHLPAAESRPNFRFRSLISGPHSALKRRRPDRSRATRPTFWLSPRGPLGEMPYLQASLSAVVFCWWSGSSVAHTDDNLDQHRGSPDTVEGYRRKYDRRADLPGQVNSAKSSPSLPWSKPRQGRQL